MLNRVGFYITLPFLAIYIGWKLLDPQYRRDVKRMRYICRYCPRCEYPSNLCRKHQWDTDYLFKHGEMNPIYDEQTPRLEE